MSGCKIYAAMARREKNSANKTILQGMASDEMEHANLWKGYTGEEIAADGIKVAWYGLVSRVMGFTFVLKLIQKDEMIVTAEYNALAAEIPEAARLAAEEYAHEERLIEMLDEERLRGCPSCGALPRWQLSAFRWQPLPMSSAWWSNSFWGLI